MGEEILSAKFVLPAGLLHKEGVVQSWRTFTGSQSLTVRKVFWEVYACPADLDALLWHASLQWAFNHGANRVNISHLAYCTGSWGDLLFPAGEGDLEKLAQAGNSVSEEQWRAWTQSIQLHKGLAFRGAKAYTQHPVLLPRNESAFIELVLDEYFTPEEDIRIRICIDGVWRREIDI
tara:strand:+ start:222 stop:752 length:531 start_codon:yes stop_codon:yes gene_type:complete